MPFPYHSPLNWPDLPPAIAECYIRRYLDWSTEYGLRWKRLDDLVSVPSDPGAEVFEAAESTVRTFYSDEEWFGDEDHPNPIVVYTASVTGQDWLNLADEVDPESGFLYWRGIGNQGYPTPEEFSSTRSYIQQTWIVWRMHQLLICEQLYRVQYLNWQSIADD